MASNDCVQIKADERHDQLIYRYEYRGGATELQVTLQRYCAFCSGKISLLNNTSDTHKIMSTSINFILCGHVVI